MNSDAGEHVLPSPEAPDAAQVTGGTNDTTFSDDFSRARWDVGYFAERFLGVTLHPGQLAMADAYLRRNASGWRAAYHTLAISAGNRAGKTMALAIIIIHACLYKMGTQPPLNDSDHELTRWSTRPFQWFHFAISQEVADLVFDEITHLFGGTHVAQPNGCPLVDEIAAAGGPRIATTDVKYKGDYRWVVFDPMLGGAEIHFRTTGERALGSLGRDMNGESMDECGLEPKLLWIYNNVFHLRRLGTGGQLIFVSTPEEGLTEFADLWFMGDPESPDRRAGRMSLRMSSRENIGYGLDEGVFAEMTADMTPEHIAQNIDGYFIQGRAAYFNANSVDNAFIDTLEPLKAAKHGHAYVQGVDSAIENDSMWSIVLDVKPDKGSVNGFQASGVRVERSRGKKTTTGIVELAATVHNAYSVKREGVHTTCMTAIDATGWGGKMFKQDLEAAIPNGVRAIEFGGTIQQKRKLLGDLRTMLDSGKLKMPREGDWLAVRRQLLGYKIDDRHIEQDAVMALACAVAEVRRVALPTDLPSSFDWRATDPRADVPVRPNFRKPRVIA